MEVQEGIKETYRAVLYTDGSMQHPINRDIGYIGGSVHGFIYNIKDIGIANKDLPTSFITTTINSYGTMVNDNYKVTPSFYIDGLFTRATLYTNNIAELTSILYSINKILELEIALDKIYINSDSSYALHVYDELLLNPTYIPEENKKNGDIWLLIKEQIIKCKNNNIEIVPIKVKGHSGDFGNDMADMLANHARYLTVQNIEVNNVKEDIDYVTITQAKKYWKPNIEKNPFLTCKSLFFLQSDRLLGTNEGDNVEKRYTIMDYPTNRELGTNNSDALYGTIIVKDINLEKEFLEIEQILDLDKGIIDGVSMLSELSLDNYYSQRHLHYKNCLGGLSYRPNKYETGIQCMDINLTYRTFQGLAKLTYNKTRLLEDVYVDFLNIDALDDNIKIIDITDLVYGSIFTKAKIPVEKKLCKIDMKDKTIITKVKAWEQDIKICINIGTEIPVRNILKKLEKNISGVYVHLRKNKKNIEISTILNTDNIIGIYTNLYTRNILLK